MSQYQSFPDAVGHSCTVDKLKALRLPDLAGKTFLDVGCNEGFFCGFAKFQGAARSVGLDHSELFVGRARERFPGCEFLVSTWDRLPAERFDVILLASALHYASDQAALVQSLVGCLEDDGLLVLELGIASSEVAEWITVQRGIDERIFPSMPMVKEMLSGFVWKWMGPSVRQQGDPVARHVIHVARKRPVAYLLMQPPGYGKSSLASETFSKAGLRVISGDMCIHRIARGEVKAPDSLRDAIREDYSPFRIDEATKRVFGSGLATEMVDQWVGEEAAAGRRADLVLDAYVPVEYHDRVAEVFSAHGFLPVRLQWDRPGPAPMPAESFSRKAEEFYLSLTPRGGEGSLPRPVEPQGFVDEVLVEAGRLVVRGWAVDEAGGLPGGLEVRLGGRRFRITDAKSEMRPDVQQHLSLPHALVGFVAIIQIEGYERLRDIESTFQMLGPGELRFQLSGSNDTVFRKSV